jgi:hypothetical protein
MLKFYSNFNMILVLKVSQCYFGTKGIEIVLVILARIDDRRPQGSIEIELT